MTQSNTPKLYCLVVLVYEAEIRDDASDLFASGHYNSAVVESFKAVDIFVAKKANLAKQSGTVMVEAVFFRQRTSKFNGQIG